MNVRVNLRWLDAVFTNNSGPNSLNKKSKDASNKAGNLTVPTFFEIGISTATR